MTEDPRAAFRDLYVGSRSESEPSAWFDRLYQRADEQGLRIPWDRGAPVRHLVEWADANALDGSGQSALVIGCGTGDDAEFVASRGFATTAFDISPTAIRLARERFPHSAVTFVVADLFDLPDAWRGFFDLVVENLTIQTLPDDYRLRGIDAIRRTVAPGGALTVFGSRRDEGTVVEGPPWPLTRSEVEAFARDGLEAESIEELSLNGTPRWRAIFRRAAADDPAQP